AGEGNQKSNQGRQRQHGGSHPEEKAPKPPGPGFCRPPRRFRKLISDETEKWGQGDPGRQYQAAVTRRQRHSITFRSAKSTGVGARCSHHPLTDPRQFGIPAIRPLAWRWRTDHEVRCPRSPAPSHEDGRAAFDRRVRRCRVPAGPPGYGAGKLRGGQGNDAGILDLPWKIEWGYY